MHHQYMAAQFLYCFQRINTAFWPMAQVGADAKVWMIFHSEQYSVRIPVMTHPFPMFMYSDLNAVDSSETINTVPHVQWWFARYIVHPQLFGYFKLLYPRAKCRITGDIHGFYFQLLAFNKRF